MPLMEVTLEQTYAGQEIVNRWNYLGAGTPAAVSFSFALVSALGAVFDEVAVPPGYPADGLMQMIANIQNVGVSFQTLTCKAVYSATDFFSVAFVNPLVGMQTGDGMSPTQAFGFRTNRVRSDIRRATKRFVGVSEADVGTLGIIVAGFMTSDIIPLAEKMTEVLEYDDSSNLLTFTPCVVKKERYDPETQLPSATGTAYRYYEDPEVQEDLLATSVTWEPYDQVRTQVSRQYGRGR
jgi:hypothetical protein